MSKTVYTPADADAARSVLILILDEDLRITGEIIRKSGMGAEQAVRALRLLEDNGIVEFSDRDYHVSLRWSGLAEAITLAVPLPQEGGQK